MSYLIIFLCLSIRAEEELLAQWELLVPTEAQYVVVLIEISFNIFFSAVIFQSTDCVHLFSGS